MHAQVEGKRKRGGDKPSLIMVNAFSGKVRACTDGVLRAAAATSTGRSIAQQQAHSPLGHKHRC